MKLLKNLLRKFLDLKLRTKLIISYVTLIAVPTIITGFMYYNTSSNIILDSASQNIYEIVKKDNRILDLKFSQIEGSANQFILDSDLYTIFNRRKTEDQYELVQMDRNVENIMNKYFSQYEDIFSVFVVTNYFRFGKSDFTFLKRDIFDKSILYSYAQKAKGKLQWVPTYNVKEMYQMQDMQEITIDPPYLFSAVKQLNLTKVELFGRVGNAQSGIEIKSLDEGIEKPVLILNFKEDMLKAVYDAMMPEGSYNCIISADGRVISYPDSSKLAKKEPIVWREAAIRNKSGTLRSNIEGKEVLVCYDTMNTTGWISAEIVPIESLLSTLPIVRYYSLYFGVGFTLFAILLGLIISGWMVGPLKRLQIAIKRMGKGEFDNRVQVTSNDEIGFLVQNFNEMNSKIQQLIEENYKTKIREKEAHIMALDLQLNPHFLSNTLNIINWMAIENKQTDISKMILSLSSMLEYTLRQNKEIVCFKDDFEWLKNYLFIMSNRYYGIFDVVYDIDPNLGMQMVPKLFMQPFVENSIIHGFQNIQSGGIISIYGGIKNGTACFTIEDNGKGMSFDEVSSAINSDGDHIGISNIDKRIKLIFGEDYGVAIKSEQGKRTKVTVIMPYREEEGGPHAINT